MGRLSNGVRKLQPPLSITEHNGAMYRICDHLQCREADGRSKKNNPRHFQGFLLHEPEEVQRRAAAGHNVGVEPNPEFGK